MGPGPVEDSSANYRLISFAPKVLHFFCIDNVDTL